MSENIDIFCPSPSSLDFFLSLDLVNYSVFSHSLLFCTEVFKGTKWYNRITVYRILHFSKLLINPTRSHFPSLVKHYISPPLFIKLPYFWNQFLFSLEVPKIKIPLSCHALIAFYISFINTSLYQHLGGSPNGYYFLLFQDWSDNFKYSIPVTLVYFVMLALSRQQFIMLTAFQFILFFLTCSIDKN